MQRIGKWLILVFFQAFLAMVIKTYFMLSYFIITPWTGHLTCRSCQNDPRCGWCDDGTGRGSGKCLEGSLEGVSESNEIGSVKNKTCPAKNWFWVDCPLCNCSGHSQCDADGNCEECQNFTSGTNCERCMVRSYLAASFLLSVSRLSVELLNFKIINFILGRLLRSGTQQRNLYQMWVWRPRKIVRPHHWKMFLHYKGDHWPRLWSGNSLHIPV